jgi:hypothetical protein
MIVANAVSRQNQETHGMYNMDTGTVDAVVGSYCSLRRPIRDRHGVIHFNEKPRVVRQVVSLDRLMFLVEFNDGSTMFLFPEEVIIE